MENSNVRGFVEKLALVRKNVIFDIIDMIQDQNYLQEVLLLAKLTEKNYSAEGERSDNGNWREYHRYIPANVENDTPTYFLTAADRYYVIRQAIAIKSNLSEEIKEILCEDKNLNVLTVVATRKDLSLKMIKSILKIVETNTLPRYGQRQDIINNLILNYPKVFNSKIISEYPCLENTYLPQKTKVVFDKQRKIPYEEPKDLKSTYSIMRRMIEKDVSKLSKKEVEEIYFAYVKPILNNQTYDKETQAIFSLFIEYYPNRLISKKVIEDLTDSVINSNIGYDYEDKRNFIIETFKTLVQNKIKFDYEKLINKFINIFTSVQLRRNDPVYEAESEYIWFCGDIPIKFADICSIPNIDVEVIESIVTKFKEYESTKYNKYRAFELNPIYMAILDNKTIDFSSLHVNIVNNIYNYYNIKENEDAINKMIHKGFDDPSLVYNRKIVERVDTPLSILKKFMKSNDPFIHLNLLNNPNSDKDIIQYIYNNTNFMYIKNKATELLNQYKLIKS